MAKMLLGARYGLSAQPSLKEPLATAPIAPRRGVAVFQSGAPSTSKVTAPELPRSPRQMSTPRSFTPPIISRSCTPPPLVQSHRLAKPMLMKALENKSGADVRAVLQRSPETVNEPFWDHDCEPPICCAARLNCPATIVQILLEHGASIGDTDVRGRTPAQILSESQQQPREARLPWETNTDGGPVLMGSVVCSPHVLGAPLDIEEMWPPTAFFRSYPCVGAAPYFNELEMIHAELEKLFTA